MPRQLYLAWHKEANAGVAVSFPLAELAIKTFCVACAKAGFSSKRILNNIFRGHIIWSSQLLTCVSGHNLLHNIESFFFRSTSSAFLVVRLH